MNRQSLQSSRRGLVATIGLMAAMLCLCFHTDVTAAATCPQFWPLINSPPYLSGDQDTFVWTDIGKDQHCAGDAVSWANCAFFSYFAPDALE